jgi:hypothetical protein
LGILLLPKLLLLFLRGTLLAAIQWMMYLL